MNITRKALASALGLALTASALVACSAPEADIATQDAPAASVAKESQPVSGGVAVPADATAPAAAPEALPTGPGMDRIRSMVGMSAGLFALSEACAPGRNDEAAIRKVVRQTPGREHLGLSEAQMDALFDAEYAKNKRKLDALSDAETAASCKEVTDMVTAGAQAQGG